MVMMSSEVAYTCVVIIDHSPISFTSPKVTEQNSVDTKGAFKMAVWLTVYYEFFDKNVRYMYLSHLAALFYASFYLSLLVVRKSQRCYVMPSVEKGCPVFLKKVT